MINTSNKVALVFGGQNTSYVEIGQKLLMYSSKARDIFEIAQEITGCNVKNSFLNCGPPNMNQELNSQICIFSVELAMFELCKEQIDFSAVAGLSLGEYAALVASNALTIENAFKLISARAKAMESEVNDSAGRMIAILGLSVEDINSICGYFGFDNTAISNYNSYNQIIVSLKTEYYHDFLLEVQKADGYCLPLKVKRPFHHVLMQPAAEKFRETLNIIKFEEFGCDMYSNYTGRICTDCQTLKHYLYYHIFHPVRWIEIIENMRDSGIDTFYEISPKPVLNSFINNISNDKSLIVDVQEILFNK